MSQSLCRAPKSQSTSTFWPLLTRPCRGTWIEPRILLMGVSWTSSGKDVLFLSFDLFLVEPYLLGDWGRYQIHDVAQLYLPKQIFNTEPKPTLFCSWSCCHSYSCRLLWRLWEPLIYDIQIWISWGMILSTCTLSGSLIIIVWPIRAHWSFWEKGEGVQREFRQRVN